MKFFTFHRISNDFSDVLADPVLKKKYKTSISFTDHLILGIPAGTSGIESYIAVKYSDDLRPAAVTDRSPVAGIDYNYPVLNT